MQPVIRLRHVVAMLALPVLLGACSEPGDVDDDAPATTESTGDACATASPDTPATGDPDEEEGDAPTTACANPEEGYELAYPAGWHVNDPGTAGPCRVFDPRPFTLQPQSEIPSGLAVVVKMEHVSMERMLEGDAQEGEVLRREELTVAGREAVLLEVRAGQDAPLQEPGTISYRYLIRLSPERTFVARTTDRGETPYEDKRRVLDRMVSTLRFFEPSPAPSP